VLVSDIITSAFLDLNEITVGRTIATTEQTDAFARLNMMLDEWSSEQLMVPNVVHQGFTLTANYSGYTLGVGGTLTTSAQPIRVTGAASVWGAGFRSAVKVVSFDKFDAEIEDPLSTTAVLAKVLAADGASPLINLRVFPTPAASPGTLYLDYWTALAAFVTVGDTVSLPVGFDDALHYNLALKLYPLYARPGTTALELITRQAAASKAKIAELTAAILGTRLGIEAGAPATVAPVAPPK
jgi:hypothetical protein